MNCEGHEEVLALHVEGELPPGEARELEHHLQQCARCRELLASLEDSQRAVHSLSDEPLDDAVLGEVRSRVLESVAGGALAPPAGRPRWGWALAAGLVLLVTGIVLLRRGQPVTPPHTRQTATSTPVTSPVQPRPSVPRSASVGGSTTREAKTVSPGVERRPNPRRFALSPEDADQLARAVVAVSRVQRLSEPAGDAATAAARPSDVVRLETADPDVVIYWQLDSSGG